MKTLIVDDSALARKMLKHHLSQLGHEDVIEATDGREALVKLRSRKPDLVFLDIHMPSMDGPYFLGEMRTQRDVADTPVVVISADTDPKQNEAMHILGARCYLTKPFTRQMLREAIATATKPTAQDKSA